MAKHYKYKTLQGDTFDSIALDFYKSEKRSGDIMQANPEHIDTIVFSAGTELKIPVIEQRKATTLPPWKR